MTSAVQILSEAQYPLVTGLNFLGSRSIKAAVKVARKFRAVIDVDANDSDEISSLVREGKVTATMAEMIQRTDRLLLIDCDPNWTHPRLLQGLLSNEKKLEVASLGRQSIVSSDLPVAKQELKFAIETLDTEYDLMLLQAEISGVPVSENLSSERWQTIKKVCDWLRSGTYVSILVGESSSSSLDTVTATCKVLNRDVKAVTLHLSSYANSIGAENILAAATGFPRAVSFANGYARVLGQDCSAAALIARGELDALLAFDASVLTKVPLDLPTILFQLPGLRRDENGPRNQDGIKSRSEAFLKVELDALDDDYFRADHLSFTVVGNESELPAVATFLDRISDADSP